ncbi:MAG: prolyl oligopeptidase family serine peptidase [Acidobacteriota bacterium]|jgi:dipeptidyl aminopeptidase/acylaminoacyl peptidase
MRRFLAVVLLAAGPALFAQKKMLSAPDLWKIARISEPALSPDGKTVAFTVRRFDVERNSSTRQIFTVPLEGGEPKAITAEGTVNERPRWSVDSKRIFWISNRGGSPQVWVMNADGSSPRQITSLSTEAGGHLISPDGKSIVFQSSVYPDCPDDACNKKRIEAEAAAKSKARVYTGLLYRHWTEYQSLRRNHLFTVPIEGGKPRDLTPGPRDVPPFSLGGPDDYAISPDGGELCYVANLDENPALSTNHDLFVVPMAGGEAKKITVNNAADVSPVYSPDGRYLAYRAQARAGFESDKWRLVVMERATGTATILTEALDRAVQSITWSADSKRLFYTIEDRGRQTLQLTPVAGGGSQTVVSGASHIDDVQFTPDGRVMIYSEHSGSRPVEIFKTASRSTPVPLTRLNEKLLESFEIPALEEIYSEGAEKARVHSFLLKPSGFDPKKKYPVLFLIHGGPQGAWGQSWSYRWNPHVFAAAGYVVVMPNPRGSTGYGQKFTDEVSDDWGGKVYDDIMAVVDKIETEPWADKGRFAAAGGSFGGYMVNWILGRSKRFQALVSHAGVFDLRSMAGETEELWFVNWEFKGMPWDQPETYAKFSPSYFVKEFKTPTLVLHGELDYRVPAGQGLQLFTGLQMMKVPSKLVLFPDEGHWILKPQNSLLWYQSFLDWINEFTAKKAE